MLFGYNVGSSPEMLALSILVSTFFLEDAAIGYAALLATTGMIAPLFAFTVLFLGIYVGDVGLYYLGAAARHFEIARAWIGEGRICQARRLLRRRALITLVGARAIPGSRLPIYAASGFVRLPFATFAGTTAVATLIWTAAIFSAIYAFGMHATELFGKYKFIAGLIVLVVVVVLPLLSSRLVMRRTSANHV